MASAAVNAFQARAQPAALASLITGSTRRRSRSPFRPPCKPKEMWDWLRQARGAAGRPPSAAEPPANHLPQCCCGRHCRCQLRPAAGWAHQSVRGWACRAQRTSRRPSSSWSEPSSSLRALWCRLLLFDIVTLLAAHSGCMCFKTNRSRPVPCSAWLGRGCGGLEDAGGRRVWLHKRGRGCRVQAAGCN